MTFLEREWLTDAINNSKSIVVDNFETALELIDAYGPEHFIVFNNER